jgi:NAD(P)H-dependent FMN reductase
VVISYGHRGGGKAAEQLRQVLDGLKMPPTAAMPTITLTKEMLADTGRLKDPSIDFAQYVETVITAAEELAQRQRNSRRVG